MCQDVDLSHEASNPFEYSNGRDLSGGHTVLYADLLYADPLEYSSLYEYGVDCLTLLCIHNLSGVMSWSK